MRLHRWSVRHPIPTLAIAILVTAAAAPGISKLRLRTDGHALVPKGAPAVRVDRAVRNTFGFRDPIVVVVRTGHPSGIWNPATLRLVADLSAALARLPGLDSTAIRSLATETSGRFRPGSLHHRRLLEPLPESRAALDELRADVAAIGLFTGTLVSFDQRATALLVGTPPEVDRTAVIAAVHDAIARADTAGQSVSVIGAPAAEALLGSHILEDLGVSWRVLGRGPERFVDADAGTVGTLSRLRLAVARSVGLLPLAIIVMALVFWVAFRSLTATLLPLAEAAACLVFVFGLMGWTGVPVYLTMAVLPVILVSMGLADEIHVFTHVRRLRAERPGEPIAAVVSAALDEMTLPVAATALTTAIGFLSFATSPMGPVRAFGLFTAIGIVFCMVWTLTVIPAMLVLFSRRAFDAAPRASRPADARGGGPRRLAAAIVRRPAVTLVIASIAVALAPLGIRRLVVQDSWISGFAPESAFYRATQYFNRQFFGAHLLLLSLDTGHVETSGEIATRDLGLGQIRLPIGLTALPRDLVGCTVIVRRRADAEAKRVPSDQRAAPWESIVQSAAIAGGRIVITTPAVHGSPLFLFAAGPEDRFEFTIRSQRLGLPDVLRRVQDLERFTRSLSRYTVGGVLGPPEQIETAELIVNQLDPGSRLIPSDPDHVRWLWRSIGEEEGPERRGEVVDAGLERGLVTVFLKNANFVDTQRLMDTLRVYEREHLAPEGITMAFAGDVAVSQALIGGIVTSQVRSLLGSLLGVLIVTALLFRSLRWGVFCMVPAALSVIATFAMMGWTGMPLGVATSMFAGMALGIGVDFAIHLIERFRVESARGADRETAILDALAATGPAIAINALAVALGFGILTLSQVPANARLGSITVVSLVTCLIATMLVTPALLRVAGGGAGSARD